VLYQLVPSSDWYVGVWVPTCAGEESTDSLWIELGGGWGVTVSGYIGDICRSGISGPATDRFDEGVLITVE
jgi:hypothetical protein